MISKSEIPEPGNWCVGDVAEVVTGNTPSRAVERFSRGAVGRVLLRPETSEPGISGDSGTSFRHSPGPSAWKTADMAILVGRKTPNPG